MSRWVWCVGFMILVMIGAAVGLGWYFSHQNKSTTMTAPRTVGGQAGNHTNGPVEATTAHASGTKAASASLGIVTPTLTVARRELDVPYPTGLSRKHASLRHRHDRIINLD
jgi:hypothetical protein